MKVRSATTNTSQMNKKIHPEMAQHTIDIDTNNSTPVTGSLDSIATIPFTASSHLVPSTQITTPLDRFKQQSSHSPRMKSNLSASNNDSDVISVRSGRSHSVSPRGEQKETMASDLIVPPPDMSHGGHGVAKGKKSKQDFLLLAFSCVGIIYGDIGRFDIIVILLT